MVEETAGGKVGVLDAVGFPEDVTDFYIFTWFCIIKEQCLLMLHESCGTSL